MASVLLSGLGLSTTDFNNKLILVCEKNQSDSSFLMASFMWKGLMRSDEKVPTNICLLSLHNTQEHYENISLKLGLNIGNYIRKGSIVFLDGLKYINSHFNSNKAKVLNEDVSSEFCKKLFLMVKEKVDLLSQSNRNNVYLLIDDVSDLLSAGFSVRSVLLFVKYCRTLLSDRRVSLTIGMYLSEKDIELSVLYKNIFCTADYYILVSGLVTGFSADVTGAITVVEKTVNEFGYNEQRRDFHHFKFNDRQVKVFSPGSIE